jgi:hypothetical protein
MDEERPSETAEGSSASPIVQLRNKIFGAIFRRKV